MDKKQHAHSFLLIMLIASIAIVYFIAKPFLGPLILAAVFAFLFQSLYQKFLNICKKRESVAAFVTTSVVVVLILLPILFLGSQIFKESSNLYQSLIHNGGNGFSGSIENILNQSRTVLPIPADFEFNISQYVKQGLEIVIQNLGAVFSSLAKILLNSFVFLTAFYFFLKDGRKLKKYFITLSPLDDADDEFIISRLKSGVSAAMKGNLAIGFIQGILTGIGFAVFGVPNPVLWGGVAVIAAFLPGIGTALVITPAIIFLFLTGNTFGGVGLLIWGVIAVGLVDHILGPRLVGRGMQLHSLAVFISVLGGMAFFGPLGFLLGPLAVSVCMALVDIYTSVKVEDKRGN
jgi:predicted PurR-regulated permease PerM